MANEYFHRTPTSTGNRKVWTLSLWLKRNAVFGDTGADAIFNAANTASSSHGTDIRFRKDNSSGDNNGWNFYDYNGGAFTWVKYGDNERRDSGNWFHAMFVFDSTKPRGDDRVEVYINGVLDTAIMGSYDTNPSTNYETYVNSITKHYLGVDQFAGSLTTSYSKSQFSDVFLVDGQALTPDVFGFFKDGKGYQSSGTTEATDFRPGQWSPHSPRKIKTEIERKGGFGVNGFYLPMNDSSNVGADFHCTPNSIITLKGEDLPQPRNGAPTTSDAYVSQLRSDPYAANLVLAVPGISTSTSSTLITNGTFDSNISGWTTVQATTSWQSGVLRIVPNASVNGAVYQSITTEVGKRYTVSMEVVAAGAAFARLHVGTSTDIDSADKYTYTSGGLNNIGVGKYTASFTPTTTTTIIWLEVGGGQQTQVDFDNVVVKQEDAPKDYSADIKGSGSNKTLTPNGGAGVGYEIPSYYGSAMRFDGSGDYFTLASNSDFAFGTEDFTIECWVNFDDLSASLSDIVTSGTQTGGFGLYCANAALSFVSQSIEIVTGTDLTTGQWNHIVAERYGSTISIYLNGVTVGVDITSAHTMTQDSIAIGAQVDGSNPIDGILQDLRIYKGVAKYKGGFDVPKPYTPVNFEGDSWRQVSDTCKNNFCTMNPLNHNNATFANGNLTTSEPAANGAQIHATMGSNTGKWYYEAYIEDVGSPNAGGTLIGINPLIRPSSNIQNRTAYRSEGSMYNDSGTSSGSSAYAYVAGDTIGVAWDADNKRLWFAKNGTWLGSGDPAGNSNPNVNYTNTETQGPFIAYDNGNGAQVTHLNFGQNPTFSGTVTAGTNADGNGKGLFKYQPPAGYLALCEDNLPTPAIADPGENFKTVLYTGDNTIGRSITGVGFTPDLVWIKNRSNADNHVLFDSVRGQSGGVILPSNTSTENGNQTLVQSLSSDGFVVGNTYNGAGNNATNGNGHNLVAWCWKAGGAAVANTDGTITSQVSANQDAGFSIVSYTGNQTDNATVGHGLGKVPDVIFVKNRNSAVAWGVWHSSLTSGQVLRLNTTTEAQTPTTAYFQDENNTSSVFALGTNDETNDSDGDTYIAYCWTEIEGYSKFGSYTGNGSTDGTFVYCGFKPAWVLIKQTNDANNWHIADSSRKSINPVNMVLRANLTNTESANNSGFNIDFLSNGFKLRSTNDELNENTSSYSFMAFAESPFQTANAK